MPFTRRQIQDAVNRAGEAHVQALIDHHEKAYPESRPTPGDVCAAEAERLNGMGLGDHPDFELLETRVERASEKEVRIVHVFLYKPLGVRFWTEPYVGYG
jgi:hypothetical protein